MSTDAFTYTNDSRPRRCVSIDYEDGRGRQIHWDLEDPTPEQASEALAAFVGLTGDAA